MLDALDKSIAKSFKGMAYMGFYILCPIGIIESLYALVVMQEAFLALISFVTSGVVGAVSYLILRFVKKKKVNTNGC